MSGCAANAALDISTMLQWACWSERGGGTSGGKADRNSSAEEARNTQPSATLTQELCSCFGFQLQCDLSEVALCKESRTCRPQNPEQPGFLSHAMNILGGALLTSGCQHGHYSPARSASQSGRSGRPAAAYRRKTSCCISLRVLHHATELNVSSED